MRRHSVYRQRGFTVHEMLLVIVLLIILLAVSVVGLMSYARRLQLTELDNSAREIFLAAQNRAILLGGGQRLEGLVVKDDGSNRIDHVEVLPGAPETVQISVYHIHKDDANISDLLPQESIDPALWDGDFYITYEPESGSIVDVFYAEEPLPVEDGNFASFYTTWRAAPKEQRMDSKPMIGYYGGESAESGTAISLRTPIINIQNDNSLQVQVTYWVPRTLDMVGESEHIHLDVTLQYQGQEQAMTLGAPQRVDDISVIGYVYTWVLDDLEGKHFYELFSGSGITYGDDFTVTADVSYSGDLQVNGARKSATDNSLFAKGSGEETARIACLRHLQNLDVAYSRVSGKTAAIQINHILEVEGYTFDPIENGELLSYDGQTYTIENIVIRSNGTAAGLFGDFSGVADKILENIRLVNANVTSANGTAPVGALVGHGANLTLTNCQVYWENQSEEHINLRYLLGDSVDGFRYQVNGTTVAGGLAGVLTNATLTNCSASTLVSAPTAGGLVGQGSDLSIAGSYAASYLKGQRTAGLVGDLQTASDIGSSYAVGYMDTATGGYAAGLCLGNGRAKVTSSYSAMLFTVDNLVTNFPLCQTDAEGDYTRTYFLDSALFGFGTRNEAYARSYDDLVDSSQWDTLFGAGTFTAKTTAQSHAYNLQTTLSLSNYTYPGLAALDHWGDWGAQFQNGSLVYYEKYAGTPATYGFIGSGVSYLRDDLTVVEDGYAMAYRGDVSSSAIDITLSIQYQTAADTMTPVEKTYGKSDMYQMLDVTVATGEQEDYYLLPLPAEIVNSDYADAAFYQEIAIRNTSEEVEKRYYFNPHFANAIKSYDETVNPKQLAVEIRSPRHLYHLSRFPTYYASNNQYRFLQEMDLEYTTYTGYDLFTGTWAQNPIGVSAAQPFRCSYYGKCHSITGVRLADNDYQYLGLFGYQTGVLQDVVYDMGQQMTMSRKGSSTVVYVGGLVGYNGGTVDNCAVYNMNQTVECYEYSTAYLGGLAGRNEGVIRSSAAEVASLTANTSMSNAYVGGFVGLNTAGGSIDQCYAVGSVSAIRGRHGTVYACGFAGRNSAVLKRSYAAAQLTVSGDAVSFGFCSDSSTNCVYLNDGNFTYRGQHYAAKYSDNRATGVTWSQLTNAEPAAAVTNLGMQWMSNGYPYPTKVVDGADDPIHYGQWPDRMDLGSMGVYYWEKLDIDGAFSYHITAISQVNGQAVESSTLSTSHGDGGVVTEYGYGYFYSADANVPERTSAGIGYGNTPNFAFASGLENQEANNALAALTGNRYSFHSYNTWGTAQEDQGLYQISAGDSTKPPNGTWTLKQGSETLSVQLNPFFANALSIAGKELPGTEKNPYEVRSIQQLQFINWNQNAKNTIRRMDRWNKEYFPYLCYGSNGQWTLRPYCWEQTHDLEGQEGVTYTPIAAVYDETSNRTGDLFGWFGGTYNGNDYLIANVDIKLLEDTQTLDNSASCVGLFGAVFNGTLKNIVLYSEDGTAVVEGNNCGESRWFAIGALAGLAGSTDKNAIVNCTVSGYTVKDTHRSTNAGGWGGTGLGGLIGVTDMSLEGCTAAANVVLDSINNDHVRVGGLVGSCQGSISSCYTGGSITVTKTAEARDQRDGYGNLVPRRIYVGGIVGGIYLKPQTVGGRTNVTVGKSGQYLQNKLINCYTYTKLPALSSNSDIHGLYAVGGSGELNTYGTPDGNADHGYSVYENSYYLSSVVLQDNQGTISNNRNDLNSVIGLTYAQMADIDTADGLLQRLNSKGGGFSTVTIETANQEPLSGRYSFADDPSLLGKNYPFPTILTQFSDVAKDNIANVHYGNWPLEGIRRKDGALPVNFDLFADYDTEQKNAVWKETLELSGVAYGGTWKAESSSEVVTASVDSNGNLTLIGQSAGSADVTVSYSVGGQLYTLNIEVNVSAQLRLVTAETVTLPATTFTGAMVYTPLHLVDQTGAALPEELQQKITLSEPTVEYDPDYFLHASIAMERNAGMTLRAESKELTGSTQMTASYTFTYLNQEYPATSVLSLVVVEPTVELPTVTFEFGTELELTQRYQGEEFVLKIGSDPVEVTEVQLVAFEELPEFKNNIGVQWFVDENGQEQVGTLSITAYAQPLYPVPASVRVQYQFQYAGSTHILWQYLPVKLVEKADEGEPPTEGEEPPTEEELP